jgi:hypothetical protein
MIYNILSEYLLYQSFLPNATMEEANNHTNNQNCSNIITYVVKELDSKQSCHILRKNSWSSGSSALRLLVF